MRCRTGGRIVSTAVIVAVAVNRDGRREVLGLDIGPSEDECLVLSSLKWARTANIGSFCVFGTHRIGQGMGATRGRQTLHRHAAQRNGQTGNRSSVTGEHRSAISHRCSWEEPLIARATISMSVG
jgi:hypothetical protein